MKEASERKRMETSDQTEGRTRGKKSPQDANTEGGHCVSDPPLSSEYERCHHRLTCLNACPPFGDVAPGAVGCAEGSLSLGLGFTVRHNFPFFAS